MSSLTSRQIDDNMMGPLAKALWAVAQGKMQNDAANRQGDRDMARFDWQQTKEDQDRAKSDFANAISLAAQGVAAPGYENDPQVQKLQDRARAHQAQQDTHGDLENALATAQVGIHKNQETWDSPLMRSIRGIGSTVKDWGAKALEHPDRSSTGWHQDKESQQWFHSNKDGSLEVYDPVTKSRTTLDAQGKVVGGTPPAPAATPTPGIASRIGSGLSAAATGVTQATGLGSILDMITGGAGLEDRVRANPASFGIVPNNQPAQGVPVVPPAGAGPSDQPPAAQPVTLNGNQTAVPDKDAVAFDAWHNLNVSNPVEFVRQVKAIQASDPGRAQRIVAEVRARQSAK